MTNIAFRSEEAAPAACEIINISPQDELSRIRKEDRSLAGFVRCLEIVEQTGIFKYRQMRGYIASGWLGRSRRGEYCAACIGAFMAWFFRTRLNSENCYRYDEGVLAMAGHLGISGSKLATLVRKHGAPIGPFGNAPWGTPPSKVFRALQKQFPDK